MTYLRRLRRAFCHVIGSKVPNELAIYPIFTGIHVMIKGMIFHDFGLSQNVRVGGGNHNGGRKCFKLSAITDW